MERRSLGSSVISRSTATSSSSSSPSSSSSSPSSSSSTDSAAALVSEEPTGAFDCRHTFLCDAFAAAMTEEAQVLDVSVRRLAVKAKTSADEATTSQGPNTGSQSSSSSSERLKYRPGLGKRSQGLFLEWDTDCLPSRRDSAREVFRKSHDHAVRRLFEALPHEQLEGREGAPPSAGPGDGPWSVAGRTSDGGAQTGFDAVAPRLWRHGNIPGRVVHNLLGSCVCRYVHCPRRDLTTTMLRAGAEFTV